MGDFLPGRIDHHLLGRHIPGYNHRSLKQIDKWISFRLGDESSRRFTPKTPFRLQQFGQHAFNTASSLESHADETSEHEVGSW
jgi:hypothetical protein